MPTLEDDQLVFRFPDHEPSAALQINFQRTLRIPDSERTYSLPPGLGRFSLKHAEDFPDGLSEQTFNRGGVIMPIWQSEALWLCFTSPRGGFRVNSFHGLSFSRRFPFAIKVAAGKINAVTGETWRTGLHRNPQDYMVAPDQPWLDGFSVEKGVIRQFVAMPLGDGYTAEEQLTGEAEWGGLQISVTPLKAEVWAEWQRVEEERARRRSASSERADEASWDGPMVMEAACASAPSEMGLGGGGRMRQHIYSDPHNLDDWDLDATQRVFVTLCHAKDWLSLTGEAPDAFPPTAEDYAKAGLPWFEWFGADQEALEGAQTLSAIKSVNQLHKAKTGVPLPDSGDIATTPTVPLGPGIAKPRPVKSGADW